MITYKHQKFLEQAIKGVLKQKTNFKIELIISDDASPDGTKEIVRNCINISNEFIKIKYFRHYKNIGAIPNFEWALKKCKGKYIALCEGDDFWNVSDKLQKQVDFLEENNDFVLSFHDRSVVDKDGNLIKKYSLSKSIKRDLYFDDLAKGIYTVPTQTVVFRNCIDKFPANFSMVFNGDTFLFLLLSRQGKFHFDKNINGAVYRIHDGGVWSLIQLEKRLILAYNTYKEMFNHFDNNPIIGAAFLNRRISLIIYYWKKKEFIKFFNQQFNTLIFVILYPYLLPIFIKKNIFFLFK